MPVFRPSSSTASFEIESVLVVGRLFYGLCDVLRLGMEEVHRPHRKAQQYVDETHQRAMVCAVHFPVDHGVRADDLDDPLSVVGQLDRRSCASGRSIAGGRLLLCPISQGA